MAAIPAVVAYNKFNNDSVEDGDHKCIKSNQILNTKLCKLLDKYKLLNQFRNELTVKPFNKFAETTESYPVFEENTRKMYLYISTMTR